MRTSSTIRKVSAAWNRRLWGFYDLQRPFNPVQEALKLNPKIVRKVK